MNEWNWGSRESTCVRNARPFGMQSCENIDRKYSERDKRSEPTSLLKREVVKQLTWAHYARHVMSAHFGQNVYSFSFWDFAAVAYHADCKHGGNSCVWPVPNNASPAHLESNSIKCLDCLTTKCFLSTNTFITIIVWPIRAYRSIFPKLWTIL